MGATSFDRTRSSPIDGGGFGNHGASNGCTSNGGPMDNGVRAMPPSPLLLALNPTRKAPLAGGEPSVLRRVMEFAYDDGFLFVAGVSRSWRGAWCVERPPETSIDAAVQSPSRLGWARASGCSWGPMICARAAAGGHLATLRYARAIGCPWDWRTCAHAASKVGYAIFASCGGVVRIPLCRR